ncbi:O-antigen polymerase [Vibrio alginolyticus]|uniref:O-antigen polymerase n=1 Tax=Vibrio alginolyticus TaxID=663 RepID=UPI00215BBF6C|nr:O-antigen polymerase [Vibrio alginolyticus]MCR9503697.1 oligosaccharide repeat unit polymerase [Vibrio alginolyticus]
MFLNFLLYAVIIFFIFICLNRMKFIKANVHLGCALFLSIWWGYYFVLKIPYYITVIGPGDSNYITIALLMIIIYLTLFFLGLQINNFNFNSLINKSIDDRLNVKKISLLCIITIIMLCIYNLNRYGTLNFIDSIKQLSERRENTTWGGVGIYLYYFVSSVFDGLGILCITLLIKHKKYFFSFLMTTLLVCLFLQAGSKYALVWFLYPIAIWSFLIKKVSLFKVFIPLFILAIIVPIMNLFRNRGEFNFSLNEYSLMLDVFLARSDLFDGLVLLVEHVEKKGFYELGITIYAIFFRFIPRDFLPDRLGSSDTYITQEIYNTNSWVFNYGGIGEFYFNFGLIGVAFIGFLSGSLIKNIDNILMKSKDKNAFFFSMILSSPFWSMPWGIGVNNLFSTMLIFWFISIPFCFVIYLLISRIKI